MKNKAIKVVLSILIVGGCLAGGYFIGANNGNEKIVSTVLDRQDVKKLYDTDLVAIVNMDEGIVKDEQKISYSQSLLGTLDIKYEITGIEAAEQGITDGKYSAYLVLPATFSESVESINHSPQKAVLEYAIAPNLTKDAQAQAIHSVGDTYSVLRSGVSEVYLSSVLSGVHKVQDSVESIKENDNKDLAAMGEISGDDLRETIQLPELASVEKQIDVLDLASAYKEGGDLLNQIDETYQSAWNQGEESFLSVKDSAIALEDKISGENGTASTYETLKKKHVTEAQVPNFEDNTDEEMQAIASESDMAEAEVEKVNNIFGNIETVKSEQDVYKLYAEDVKTCFAELVGTLGEPIAEYTDDSGQYDVKEYEFYTTPNTEGIENAKAQYSNEKLQQYHEETLAAVTEELKILYSNLAACDPVTYPPKSDEEIVEITKTIVQQPQLDPVSDEGNTTVISKEITAKIPKVEKTAPDTSLLDVTGINTDIINKALENIAVISEKAIKERNEVRTTLKEKDASIRNDIGEFDTAYNSLLTVKEKLNQTIQEHDPEKYLDTQALGNLHSSLGENQRNIQGQIEDQNQQYEEYVGEVYETADENTKKQLESIEQGQNASDEKLDSNLANAKNLKQKTYDENRAMLDEIEGVLPYTRLGTQENTMIYRFMADPVVTDELAVLNQEKEENIEAEEGSTTKKTQAEIEDKEIPIFIFIIPLAILAVIACYVVLGRKRKDAREDYL